MVSSSKPSASCDYVKRMAHTESASKTVNVYPLLPGAVVKE